MFEQKLYDEIDKQDKVQAKLARRLNITPVDFHQKMTGYHGRRFTSEERAKLAELLGVSVEALFPDVNIEGVVA